MDRLYGQEPIQDRPNCIVTTLFCVWQVVLRGYDYQNPLPLSITDPFETIETGCCHEWLFSHLLISVSREWFLPMPCNFPPI